MKTMRLLPVFLIVILLLAACDLQINPKSFQLIEPSDTLITEERQVSGFSGIDFSTFGEVILTQGESKSLTIRGSDNIVPLVETSVVDGILDISMKDGINITGLDGKNMLTFTITVKDLTSLKISGAGNVSMDGLSTSNFDVKISGAGKVTMDGLASSSLAVGMSGAGKFELAGLSANSVDISISGLGTIRLAGEADQATIVISGAGPVKAYDLKVRTARITISGLGSAEMWVTGSLNGSISGAGNVSYYGNPQTRPPPAAWAISNRWAASDPGNLLTR